MIGRVRAASSTDSEEKTVTITITPKVTVLIVGIVVAAVVIGVYFLSIPPPPPEPLQVGVLEERASPTLLSFKVSNLGRSSVSLQSIYLDGRLLGGSIVAPGGLGIFSGGEKTFSLALVRPLEEGGEHEVTLVFDSGESYSFMVAVG